MTELYQISSNGLSGAANDTIDVSAVVPEPSTWAMLRSASPGLATSGFAPGSLDNLDRLIELLFRRPPSGRASFVQLPRLETRQFRAPGLSIANTRNVRAPAPQTPEARGAFWPRPHPHHLYHCIC